MAKSRVTVFSAVTSTITILLCLSLLPTSYATVVPSSNLRSFYTRAHSLGDEYEFTALEGWYTINATDLGYKYNDSGKPSGHQSRKTSAKVVLSSDANVLSNTLSHIGGTIVHLLNEVWNDLKGFGKSEQVKITWYTGHDLLNPSCWANTKWAPTDESFTCALTLKGWNDRPQCLKFLELCNGPKKCIFVRVVDSCAGCAEGSKHVDLTKSAFKALEHLDMGVSVVQMRQATDPGEWFEDLWGPKH